jgi:hypothetical protein
MPQGDELGSALGYWKDIIGAAIQVVLLMQLKSLRSCSWFA